MNKPLTIDELKALPVGDWVYVMTADGKYGAYGRVCEKFDDDNFRVETIESYLVDPYSDYGTKWLAYKNKEQAEAKGEIVELPCLRKVTNLYSDSGCEYRVYFIRKDGVNINSFDCYAYKDKPEAERRLAELKGERV